MSSENTTFCGACNKESEFGTNVAPELGSNVAGGTGNTAGGQYSGVLGGTRNYAQGSYSAIGTSEEKEKGEQKLK